MAPLERDDVDELHCIQPFDNLASILDLGILSHYEARRVNHRSIADPRIQDRREPVVVPGTGGRKLHSYANLYVNARNKMLSKINARSWQHPEDIRAEWRHGSIMCAEVLVPDVVPPEHITGAYVSYAEAADALRQQLGDADLAITSNPDLFFRT